MSAKSCFSFHYHHYKFTFMHVTFVVKKEIDEKVHRSLNVWYVIDSNHLKGDLIWIYFHFLLLVIFLTLIRIHYQIKRFHLIMHSWKILIFWYFTKSVKLSTLRHSISGSRIKSKFFNEWLSENCLHFFFYRLYNMSIFEFPHISA